jgi:hypothetical protein
MTERNEETRAYESHDTGREEERESQERAKFTGHPPIIIPDGRSGFNALDEEKDDTTASAMNPDDIVVQFDGEGDHRHYEPEDPPAYTANSLQRIRFIQVEDDTTTHSCPNVPPNCRIVVTDKHRNNGNESTIVIDATSGTKIDITFPPGEYRREHGDGLRKTLRGALKKIKSLKVFDGAGNLVHDCGIAKSGKDVLITIRD